MGEGSHESVLKKSSSTPSTQYYETSNGKAKFLLSFFDRLGTEALQA